MQLHEFLANLYIQAVTSVINMQNKVITPQVPLVPL